jgi:hypothetical protein
MSYLLKSGKVGTIGMEQLRLIREEATRRWDSLGFLDELDGHLKENIASLYENQANLLLREGTAAEGGSSTGSFETVVFPIIRRVFSKLLANEIVSVQALNLPIGRLYFFNPKISKRIPNGPFIAGQPGFPTADAMGGQSTATYEERSLYDAYYEDPDSPDSNLYDRSKGKYTIVTGATATPQKWVIDAYGQSSLQDTTFDDLTGLPLSAYTCLRTVVLKLQGFTMDSAAGRLIGPDGNEMDTEEFLASLKVANSNDIYCCYTASPFPVAQGALNAEAGHHIDFRIVTQKYAKGIVDYGDICTPDGKIYVEVDLSCPACINCQSTDGYVGSYIGATIFSGFTTSWRVYQDLEFEDEMGEVTFQLDHVTVSVTERKLRAQWSPELAQDVSAFHNIDAEAELTAILSEEIAAEIDREILRDLRKAAAWRLRWDWNGWKRFNTGAAPYTQKDWNQTLVTAINQLSAQIYKSTLRGGANFIVVSAEISAIFDDLEYFHVSNAGPEEDQYNMGIEKIGTLSGRYTIYRDPYFPANKLLMGHKGTSILDTGYIYAPYVPLQLTPTMYNPFNFTPIKGIMTRYAKKVVNNRYYAVITIDGVRTFGIRELR